MTVIQAIILGVVEGITEFLPISSTGHLIIVSQILGVTQSEFLKSFEIFIQLGAVLAVVALYWWRVWVNRKLFWKVVVAFIPTGIIGLILYKLIKHYLLGNLNVVLWSFFLGGLVLIIFERWLRSRPRSQAEIGFSQAGILGAAQSLAVIPGVSRSAATIVAGLALGVSRQTIVEFSFLLAVPTILAATLLDLSKVGWTLSGQEWSLLIVGFISAFVVAVVVVRWFLKYVERHDFTVFGIYRVLLALMLWWLI